MIFEIILFCRRSQAGYIVSVLNMEISEGRFLSGLDLSEGFFLEAVKPILDHEFPSLMYSAALIGSGSEVLGFDTEMSTDHHWGPRVILFLSADDLAQYKDSIWLNLSEKLPRRFMGYPTSFSAADPAQKGVQLLSYEEDGPINHRVEMFTMHQFINNYLGFDLDHELSAADWLTFPEQKLRSLSAGRIFRDELGLDLQRKRFNYYPHDVWLYLLASGWNRIEQEEHLMGRAGSVGDEIGSAIIAARLVRDLMRLCFLMERCYAPYPKWFGTAFKNLSSGKFLEPILNQVLQAKDWKQRQEHLASAYEYLAAMHNKLNITAPLPCKVQPFHERPFLVISMGTFSKAIREQIGDKAVQELSHKVLIGGIDQICDNTDLLTDTVWRSALLELYRSS